MSAFLPREIITNILSRLPVKSLSRFKCVSKPWLCLIEDTNFIILHAKQVTKNNNFNLLLKHQDRYISSITLSSSSHEAKRIDYPLKNHEGGVEIIGSCNGLVCITPDRDVYCVWNPTTDEFMKLPEINKVSPNAPYCVLMSYYGFGCDDITNEYKVVRIENFFGDAGFLCRVFVFTLGTNSWRSVEGAPYRIEYKRVSGIHVNGGLHWKAKEVVGSSSEVIICFDLSNEKFKVVPQPDYDEADFGMNVGVLGECLCVVNNVNKVEVHLWVMMNYGVKESWTKLFSITQSIVSMSLENVKPLCYWEDGKILLEINFKNFVLYDLKSGEVKNPHIRNVAKKFESVTYVQSMVPLNTGTYVHEKQEKQERKQREKKTKKRFGLSFC